MKTKNINKADLLERITKAHFALNGELSPYTWRHKKEYTISDEDISTINELVGDMIEYFCRNKVEFMKPMYWVFKGDVFECF